MRSRPMASMDKNRKRLAVRCSESAGSSWTGSSVARPGKSASRARTTLSYEIRAYLSDGVCDRMQSTSGNRLVRNCRMLVSHAPIPSPPSRQTTSTTEQREHCEARRRESTRVPWTDFDEIVKTHARALFSRASHLTRERSDAWDLVQDTFERALTHRPADLPATKVRGWLFIIMQNLHLDRCRRATRHKRVALTEDVLSFVPHEEQGQPTYWQSIDLDEVRTCLDKLDPRLREPYMLQTEQGLSLAVIAAR